MNTLVFRSSLIVSMIWCTLAQAQQPASAFARGNGLQNWQHPDHKALAANCKQPPAPFAIPVNASAIAEPPAPTLPAVPAIPGIVAADAVWRVIWAWQGNNADGPIAGDNDTLLFANNDAGNVMQLDPATGLAKVLYDKTNTGGAVSRSKNGALFLAMRGLHAGVEQLQPQRKTFAVSLDGEPLDCAGGVVNDISADSKGGVYIAISGGGVFYADSHGVIKGYGKDVSGANGIILSPDESKLYVTNGPKLVVFDVQADGALNNQRDFAPLSGSGDGSAVDQDGRIYVATGAGADVIAPDGKVLGTIPGPRGMHGVAFGGKDKRTLFGIVFYGSWGTASARNQIVALPMLSSGYQGRAK
ncbi:MAG: SMP-30/gluconolactonase/LRE family protein [Gammaproteobacteria bacterium]